MSAAKQEIGKVQDAINWEIVEQHLRKSIPDLPNGKLNVRQFSEGYSNLTYLLNIDDWEGVLRRPPFGEVPPKAHDMQREFRMLEKVNPVFPLAPKPYVYCEDPAIMDKHFYVMEKKQGVVIDDVLPENYGGSEQAGPKISQTVIQTLAQLQAIDYQKAGLADMGKPEGFLERQVKGWIKRYDHSKTESIPQLSELEQWLAANLPKTQETTIVHNDFKLNNMVLDAQDPGKAVGILDWELSTIGDPMSDLGSTVAYWGQPDDPDMGINIVTSQKGFYTRREFVEAYAKASGRDVSNINYYVTFGFYKLAVILQQIHYRWKIGEIDDDRFGELNIAVRNLIEMANETRRNNLL
ncbi:phosphotransferase family protein [Planococcus sp. NCCP-2050]|uniref:phosphotransferase family protein n=1 Tax=Planococcus sp. NCCP-2050 TaxID=2944679 RepID=UPI00203D463C|nr:phosphotransferase family protein [Planococcus sp. NCCP-2050]GKW45634.1 aminoglycoside phosphotransferase [Planococcus sp. NCCP-2050]